MKGRLVLTAVSVSATVAPYEDLYKTPLNPLAFPGTTLYEKARVFQKFRFNRIKVTYCPTVSTYQSGGHALYFTDDAEYSLGLQGSIQYLNAVLSIPGSFEAPIWSPMSCTKVFKDDGSSYYMQPDEDDEERFCVQGRFGSIASAQLTAGNVYGHYIMEYDIVCWDEAFTNSNLMDSFTQVPAYITSNPTLVDNFGVGNAVLVQINTIATYVAVSTTYKMMSTYSLGDMKAFNYYYFTTGGALTGSVNLYYKRSDSVAAGVNGKVDASWTGATAEVAPVNGFWFLLQAAQDSDPQKVRLENIALQKEIANLKLHHDSVLLEKADMGEAEIEQGHPLNDALGKLKEDYSIVSNSKRFSLAVRQRCAELGLDPDVSCQHPDYGLIMRLKVDIAKQLYSES